jgi:hypothetical protein
VWGGSGERQAKGGSSLGQDQPASRRAFFHSSPQPLFGLSFEFLHNLEPSDRMPKLHLFLPTLRPIGKKPQHVGEACMHHSVLRPCPLGFMSAASSMALQEAE